MNDNKNIQLPDVREFMNTEVKELGELASVVLDNFSSSDRYNYWTGKRTYMNVEESYIASGVYSDEILEKIYSVEEKTEKLMDKKGNVVNGDSYIEYKVINKNHDQRLRLEAIKFFKDNALKNHFTSLLEVKRGGLPIDVLLQEMIINDALNGTEKEKIANRKLALDMLGLRKAKASPLINVMNYGGRASIEDVANKKGADFLKSNINDEELLLSEEFYE